MVTKFSDKSDKVMTTFYYCRNVAGLWFNEKPKIYYLYAFAYHIIFTYFFGITMFLSAFYQPNILDDGECLFMSLARIMLIIKITITIYHHGTINRIHEIIKNDLRMINDDDLYEEVVIGKGNSESSLLLFIYMAYAILASVVAILKPIFFNNQLLPFKAEYPFEWNDGNYIYYTVYSFQIIGQLLNLVSIPPIDLFPSTLLIKLCAYCDAMCYHVKNWKTIKYSSEQDRVENFNKISLNFKTINR